MQLPKFDIQLSTNSADARIFCNDENITGSIRSITVHQTAGELPIVTLELNIGGKNSFRLQAEAILKLQDAHKVPQSTSK